MNSLPNEMMMIMMIMMIISGINAERGVSLLFKHQDFCSRDGEVISTGKRRNNSIIPFIFSISTESHKVAVARRGVVVCTNGINIEISWLVFFFLRFRVAEAQKLV